MMRRELCWSNGRCLVWGTLLILPLVIIDTVMAGSPSKPPNQIVVHSLDSPHQTEPVTVRVLIPEKLQPGKTYPTIYVLPVEAKSNSQFGDGLSEVQKLDLHNKHQAIFVSPTFAQVPWYADHPTDPKLRQESHLLKVVIPFVEKTYPVSRQSEHRLLLGFSKSGAGAFALLLRHPDQFGKALAFDSPLIREQMRKGKEIFATQQNFQNYSVPKLLQEKTEQFRGQKRFLLLGKGFLQKFHQQTHALMNELKIPHHYVEGEQRSHTWDSGWLPQAVDLLIPSPTSQSKHQES